MAKPKIQTAHGITMPVPVPVSVWQDLYDTCQYYGEVVILICGNSIEVFPRSEVSEKRALFERVKRYATSRTIGVCAYQWEHDTTNAFLLNKDNVRKLSPSLKKQTILNQLEKFRANQEMRKRKEIFRAKGIFSAGQTNPPKKYKPGVHRDIMPSNNLPVSFTDMHTWEKYNTERITVITK